MLLARRETCVSLLLAAFFVAGCGSKAKTIPTSGVVTLDGEPLADARVTFNPLDASGRMAFGNTDSQGRFTLSTFKEGDGALAGQYRITVTIVGPTQEASAKLATDLKAMMKERERLSKLKLKEIPKTYQSVASTPLQQTIPAEGEVKVPLTKAGT